MEDLQKQIDELKRQIDSFKQTKNEQTKFYDFLKVNKLNAAVSTFTATPSNTVRKGEFVLVDDGSSVRKVCFYTSGGWLCATLS